MKISVYGSAAGNISEEVTEKAREVGREIVRREHVLVTGACPGLPYAAVCGAYEKGGLIMGFSPAATREEHISRFGFPTQRFNQLIFLPSTFKYRTDKGACLKLRNVYSVAASDAAIIIGGRWGTVNEFSIAFDLGRNIGILEGTGGFTEFVRPMVEAFEKSSGSEIIYSSNPVELVGELERITTPES